jgi:hypothetical protein
MNRFRDYLGFAVQFVGLGYVVLWPLSTPGRGDLFGAPLLCGGRVADAVDVVCGMPHPLRLGVGLHAVGALCAVLATLHLLVRAVGRARSRRGAVADGAAVPPAAIAVEAGAKPRLRRRRMPPPHKAVPPRSHFGLRGLPR